MFHQIRELTHHFEIHLLALNHEKLSNNSIKELEPFCETIKVFQLSKLKSTIKVGYELLIGNIPAQISYFSNRRTKSLIRKQLQNIRPDHIYFQLSRTAYYSNIYNCPKSIDLMDAFHYGAEKRATASHGIKKWFWKKEAKKLISFEKRKQSEFDNIFIISEQDKSRLAHINKEVEVLQNGIDNSFFETIDSQEAKYDIAFVGNLSYYPNTMAVDYLAHDIIPEYIKKYQEEIRCNIAGANAQKLKITPSNNIILSGWYDDIRLAYLSAKLFVAPLFHGMGQQNKILEAIALRKLCITTPQVANALGMRDGNEILVAQSKDQFVQHIHNALNNNIDTESIIENAYKKLIENFNWTNTTQKLIDIINNSDEEL